MTSHSGHDTISYLSAELSTMPSQACRTRVGERIRGDNDRSLNRCCETSLVTTTIKSLFRVETACIVKMNKLESTLHLYSCRGNKTKQHPIKAYCIFWIISWTRCFSEARQWWQERWKSSLSPLLRYHNRPLWWVSCQQNHIVGIPSCRCFINNNK